MNINIYKVELKSPILSWGFGIGDNFYFDNLISSSILYNVCECLFSYENMSFLTDLVLEIDAWMELIYINIGLDNWSAWGKQQDII